MKERFTEEQVIGFPARSRIRTVRQRAVPSAAVRQVSGTLPPESEQRSNVRNGRSSDSQHQNSTGSFRIGKPPFSLRTSSDRFGHRRDRHLFELISEKRPMKFCFLEADVCH